MRARFRGAANNGTFYTLFQCALNTEILKRIEEKQRFCSVPQKRRPKQPEAVIRLVALLLVYTGTK